MNEKKVRKVLETQVATLREDAANLNAQITKREAEIWKIQAEINRLKEAAAIKEDAALMIELALEGKEEVPAPVSDAPQPIRPKE